MPRDQISTCTQRGDAVNEKKRKTAGSSTKIRALPLVRTGVWIWALAPSNTESPPETSSSGLLLTLGHRNRSLTASPADAEMEEDHTQEDRNGGTSGLSFYRESSFHKHEYREYRKSNIFSAWVQIAGRLKSVETQEHNPAALKIVIHWAVHVRRVPWHYRPRSERKYLTSPPSLTWPVHLITSLWDTKNWSGSSGLDFDFQGQYQRMMQNKLALNTTGPAELVREKTVALGFSGVETSVNECRRFRGERFNDPSCHQQFCSHLGLFWIEVLVHESLHKPHPHTFHKTLYLESECVQLGRLHL